MINILRMIIKLLKVNLKYKRMKWLIIQIMNQMIKINNKQIKKVMKMKNMKQ